MEVLRREHLAGEEDRAEVGQRGLLQLAAQHEQRQDRRHRVPDRDPGVADPARELGSETARAATERARPRPGARRGEQVEDGEVEVEGRVAGEAIGLAHLELVDHPVDEGAGVQVGQHDALRHAGRARRVEDVGEVRLRAGDTGRGVARAAGERRRREQTDAFRSRDLTVGGVEGDERLDRRALRAQLGPGVRLLPAGHEARRAPRSRRSWRAGRRAPPGRAARTSLRPGGCRRSRRAPPSTSRGRARRGRRARHRSRSSRCAQRFAALSSSAYVRLRSPSTIAVRSGWLAADPREQLVHQLSFHVHNPMLRAAMLY